MEMDEGFSEIPLGPVEKKNQSTLDLSGMDCTRVEPVMYDTSTF